tara:strand:+ start:94 stop:588 length:495 start_codon:yes stop_codon:yes gene_type:complete
MSSIQENIMEEETQEEIQARLEQKVEALDGKCLGVQKYYNITKKELFDTKNKLQARIRFILDTKNLEIIEKYLDTFGIQLQLLLYCREGEYENKKGHKSKCWYAIRKYCGSRNNKNKDTPPAFLYTIEYDRELFNFNIEKSGYNMFEYKFDTIEICDYTFKVKK